ncbi:MAG: HAD-IIA family hydrolase [Lachnospiraceae bacterium]|nr:HAD-IIA family hydrolase [Lachnospiraceae bacterium]
MDKADVLRGVRLFVLDLDGTVYLGEELIEGADGFISALQEDETRDFVFFTNNASRVPSFYVEKLRRLGIFVEESRILTAGDVTAAYLRETYPGGRVLLNGTPILEENWRAKGIRLVEEAPDVCVQSFDTTLTYEKLERICRYVRQGVPFLATHMDTNCPTEDGYIPDCGAMCALITESTGVKPRYFGKPFAETVETIERICNVRREDMAFVGDRLYTDVATGVRNGAKGFLVLSGEADMDTVRSSDVAPTAIYASLAEMREYL